MLFISRFIFTSSQAHLQKLTRLIKLGYGAFYLRWGVKCHFPHFIAISTRYFQKEIESTQDKVFVPRVLPGTIKIDI